jgi:hypothetical protein
MSIGTWLSAVTKWLATGAYTIWLALTGKGKR